MSLSTPYHRHAYRDGYIGKSILHLGFSTVCTFRQLWGSERYFPWGSSWCQSQVVRSHPLSRPGSWYFCAGRCAPGCGRPVKGIPFTHHRNKHSHWPTVSCLDIYLCFPRHYWITFFLWPLLKSVLLPLWRHIENFTTTTGFLWMLQ